MSGIFSGIELDLSENYYQIMAMSFAAGFSERLVTSAVEKAAKK